MEYVEDNTIIEEILKLDKQMSQCEFLRIFNDYKSERNLYLKELNEQEVHKLKIAREKIFLNNYNKKNYDFKFDLISPEILIDNYDKELLIYLCNNKIKIEKSKLCDFLFLEALSKNKSEIINFYLDNKKDVFNSEENINEMINRIKNGNKMLSLFLINEKDIWEKITFNNKKKLIYSMTFLKDNADVVKSLISKEEVFQSMLYKFFYNACVNSSEETVSILHNHNKNLIDMNNESLWKLYEVILENSNDIFLNTFFKIIKNKYGTLDIFHEKNSLLSLTIRKQNLTALNILLKEGANPLLPGKKCKNAMNTLSIAISKNGINEKFTEMKLAMDKYILNKHLQAEITPGIIKRHRI